MKIKRAIFPSLNEIKIGCFGYESISYEGSCLEYFDAPLLHTISSNSAYFTISGLNLTYINLPSLNYMNGSKCIEEIGAEEVDLPNFERYNYGSMFNKCPNLKKISMPKFYRADTTNASRGFFKECPKLIDVICGKSFNSDVFILANWSPYEALLTDSQSLLTPEDITAGFTSNREKLLYNIREHIAANLPTITQGYSIFFGTNLKSAIQADQETADAFTSKGWTIA
jgi:hypothetical protein